MSNTVERLSACFANVFADLDPEALRAASVKTVPNWDSLATVTLVSLVEEEFSVVIAPDEFESLVSFEAFLAAVERARAAG